MRSTEYPTSSEKVNLLSQIFKFLCVGGFATALHYAVMFMLMHGASWEPAKASASGFLISAVFNFMLNARITFKSDRSMLHTAPRFALVCAAGLLLNHLVLTAMLSLGSHPFLAQIIATFCILSWNFIVNALWTFRNKKN